MMSQMSQSITEKLPYYFSTPSQTPYDGLDSGDNDNGEIDNGEIDNGEIVAIVKVDWPWPDVGRLM